MSNDSDKIDETKDQDFKERGFSCLISHEAGRIVRVRRGTVEHRGFLSISYIRDFSPEIHQKVVYTIASCNLSFLIEQVESVSMYSNKTVIVLK